MAVEPWIFGLGPGSLLSLKRIGFRARKMNSRTGRTFVLMMTNLGKIACSPETL